MSAISDAQLPPSIIYGDVIATRVEPSVVIEKADPYTKITLEALQSTPRWSVHIDGDLLHLGRMADGTAVAYRVTGWDSVERVLLCERVS